MLQRNQLEVRNSLDAFLSESLKVNVFTSSNCTFCNEALDAAHEAVEKFAFSDIPVKVIETSVEENPEIIYSKEIIRGYSE